jgi:DNA-binding MarR family transcriptional regulator
VTRRDEIIELLDRLGEEQQQQVHSALVAMTTRPIAKPLTERQGRVYDYLSAHVALYGIAPTIREMCAALGISSTNGVKDHLLALERKGWIRRRAGSARGLEVL